VSASECLKEEDFSPLYAYRFQDNVPDLVKQFEEKLITLSANESSSEDEDTTAKPSFQPRKRKAIPTRKPTLTEADLTDTLRKGASSKNVTKVNATTSGRSRSISVEPDGRRSRSRSVSLAAEEIKAVGGKRGGIAGNSKLFASEVEMRKAAPSGSGVSRGLKKHPSMSNLGMHNSFVLVELRSDAWLPIGGTTQAKPIQDQTLKKTTTTKPTGLLQATTLVAETPPRPNVKSTLLAGNSSDEDGVPESSEVKYIGTKLVEKVIPETPIKPKRKTKR
jgi:hypothetical protein